VKLARFYTHAASLSEGGCRKNDIEPQRRKGTKTQEENRMIFWTDQDSQYGLEADDRRAPGGLMTAVSASAKRTAIKW